jgi:6,7-dimethyl-8-ribityllumazine synthase
MSSKDKNLSEYKVDDLGTIEGKKIGVVVSEWNEEITYSLKDACVETLIKHGANKEDIHVAFVPGAFELPLGAKILFSQHQPDAIICIGCVIKGETKHDEYISNAVASGIMNLNLVSGIPVIFGVLTPNSMAQALDRAGGAHGNKGVEAAVTAIKMLQLKKEVKGDKKSIGFGG